MKNKIKNIIAIIIVAIVMTMFILAAFLGEEWVELQQVAIVVAGVAAILGIGILCRLIIKNKDRDE
jgi:hypothetical protein